MTQITFIATTANAGIEDGSVDTTDAQALPTWAPPIEFVADNTTGPFLAILHKASTGVTVLKQVVVRAYGRSSSLRGGRDCVSLDRSVTRTATKKSFLTLTYNCVGELVKP